MNHRNPGGSGMYLEVLTTNWYAPGSSEETVRPLLFVSIGFQHWSSDLDRVSRVGLIRSYYSLLITFIGLDSDYHR
jgi:hypothetical protein